MQWDREACLVARFAAHLCLEGAAEAAPKKKKRTLKTK
jgi:hypothetical protein